MELAKNKIEDIQKDLVGAGSAKNIPGQYWLVRAGSDCCVVLTYGMKKLCESRCQ